MYSGQELFCYINSRYYNTFIYNLTHFSEKIVANGKLFQTCQIFLVEAKTPVGAPLGYAPTLD